MVAISFGDERFKEVSRRNGVLQFSMFGQKAEAEYSSINFMNAGATMGYSLVEIREVKQPPAGGEDQPQLKTSNQTQVAFTSKTPTCRVVTLTGAGNGELPFPLEGVRVWGVAEGSDPAACYDGHVEALKGEPPVADAEWLLDALDNLPQYCMDIAMKAMDEALKVLGGPDGLMKAMTDAVSGIGSAMEGALKGVGDALQDGLGGTDAPKPDVDEMPEHILNPKGTAKAPEKAPVTAPKKQPIKAPAKSPKKEPKKAPVKAPKKQPKKAPAKAPKKQTKPAPKKAKPIKSAPKKAGKAIARKAPARKKGKR